MTTAFRQILDKMIESRVAAFDKDAGRTLQNSWRREDVAAVPATCAIP
jgi:hypothetical protein